MAMKSVMATNHEIKDYNEKDKQKCLLGVDGSESRKIETMDPARGCAMEGNLP